ncbi:uncharacterized protein DUF937 [Roseiarcus fermentans]|uniref:Uncharacterized protein DUF937 n=1 Tax=Roseiarcus fermentans TaxID=1473586 RepID=A0A366F7Y6_9HYPH|nr:DUF937 domain-containing protein [Roseiarcus fermentans]RBP09825.1 uncharacterized protein DUF937 [Roseiarcus fermentans]
MAPDLVGLINQVLAPQLVGGLARATGISEAAAQKLVAAAVPLVLGAIGTTVAAPGGAQKMVDAVSNSDPDLLTGLSGALAGGDARAVGAGATLLGGMLGGSGLSSLVGALGHYSGVPQPAAQTAIGAAVQAAIGTLGQQDPSNWSDPAAIAALFASQKDAIAAALPGEIAKALAPTGLLAGLGAIGSGAVRTAGASASGAADAARSAAAAATRAAAAAQQAAEAAQRAAARSRGFPVWAVVLLTVIVVVIVLGAAGWVWMQTRTAPAPAKTGALAAPIQLVLQASPGQHV